MFCFDVGRLKCVVAFFPRSRSRLFAKRTHIFAIHVCVCVFCVKRIVAILLDDKANSLLQSKCAFGIRYAFFMLLTRQSRLCIYLFRRTVDCAMHALVTPS